jgi:hypothetical protein
LIFKKYGQDSRMNYKISRSEIWPLRGKCCQDRNWTGISIVKKGEDDAERTIQDQARVPPHPGSGHQCPDWTLDWFSGAFFFKFLVGSARPFMVFT